MNNYYYITGTSRGLGKALAEYLLQNETNRVIGISRTNNITHPDYTHVTMDLRDLNAIEKFQFNKHPDAARVALINNAGILGSVKPLGKLDSRSIVDAYMVNLVGPTLLINRFMATYKTLQAEKLIINVSSGAGKRPVDGWSVYCTSKAGIDMLSRVLHEEQKTTGETEFRVFSIEPGIVDTQMQTDIRHASKEDFSRLDDFIHYKNANLLVSPEAVAKKYFTILDRSETIKDVLISVRDFE